MQPLPQSPDIWKSPKTYSLNENRLIFHTENGKKGKKNQIPPPFDNHGAEKEKEPIDVELLVTRRLIQEAIGVDSLTQVKNRKAFNDDIKKAASEALRSKEDVKLSLLMLDLDHFKEVNDTQGHQAGDRVLREVAKTLKENLPRTDTDEVARYGGDEFVVILKHTDENGAALVAERLRQAVEKRMEELSFPVTLSIGCASFEKKQGGLSDGIKLIGAADEAAARSKKRGKNKVTRYSQIIRSAKERSRKDQLIETVERSLPSDPEKSLEILEELASRARQKAEEKKTGTES